MKSPQLENGFIRIASEIIDALAAYRIPGEQMQCVMVIIRKTYGFHKKTDNISNSQFCAATGLKKGNVCRAIKELIRKNIVIKTDNGRVPTYQLNKHYRKWKQLSKLITVVKTDNKKCLKKSKTVIKTDNDKKLSACSDCNCKSEKQLSKLITGETEKNKKLLSKLRPTKDSKISKDILRKDFPPFPPSESHKTKKINCPHLKIVSEYNRILGNILPPVNFDLWSGIRRKNLLSRWKEKPERQNMKWWTEYFEMVKKTPFLLGAGPQGWMCDLGWLILPSNMVKVLEGKYGKIYSRKPQNNKNKVGFVEEDGSKAWLE